jgi:phosphopantetheinyl transferase
MPLYKIIEVSKGISVYIWQITETEDELGQGIQLTPHCQQRMDGMKSELHRRGFMSIRHLMASAGNVDQDLYYEDWGKPHLRDGKKISITHSHHFTGIIVSKESEVGIDIEMQREKILRIANKFTPLEEYKTIANTDALIRKLTIVWGAKESLFKIYAKQGLSFLHHVEVRDFTFDDTETTADILFHGDSSQYLIKFLEFDGFTCVYAIRQ